MANWISVGSSKSIVAAASPAARFVDLAAAGSFLPDLKAADEDDEDDVPRLDDEDAPVPVRCVSSSGSKVGKNFETAVGM